MDVKAREAYFIISIIMAYYSEVVVAYLHLTFQSVDAKRGQLGVDWGP